MTETKYSIEEFNKIPKDARVLAVGVIIANELNALNKNLKELTEDK